MKERIEQELEALVGMPLWGSHRAADLQGFQFGERVPSMSRATKRRPAEAVVVGEYALHVQCPWRIIEASRIVVASVDLYYAAGEDPYKQYEDFDWDKQPNRRDERIAALIVAWTEKPPTVESVKADTVGSLRIGLSQRYTLDVFPADSLGNEHWRLLANALKRKHFVVTGQGIKG
ncbi:MAG: hypothetical protein ACYDAR_14970 [Thermomicrobiales bacterium]